MKRSSTQAISIKKFLSFRSLTFSSFLFWKDVFLYTHSKTAQIREVNVFITGHSWRLFSIKRGNNRQLIRRLILCFFSPLLFFFGFSFQIDILNYIYVLPTFVWCFFYVNGSNKDKKYINGFFSDFFFQSFFSDV